MSKCGNKNCSTSKFIDDETYTFGSGKLSSIGTWEFPCKECEQDYLERQAGFTRDAKEFCLGLTKMAIIDFEDISAIERDHILKCINNFTGVKSATMMTFC